MTFVLEHIINSLGGVLKERYPNYPVYDSPNQQGTEYPCFFIFFTSSEINSEINARFMRDLGIDIVFVQQRNIENGNREIQEVADYLDYSLEVFHYSDGGECSAFIRSSDRQWQSEDGELHYKFRIRQRAAIPRKVNLMTEMEEENANVKNK